MGNAGVASAIGIGDICLENEQGGRLVLTNVKHIPEMRLNLLSVGRLDDEGYVSTFKDGGWKLNKGSLVVARGRKESSLYVLQTKLMATGHVNALEDEEATSLWHNRLAHMSEKGMAILVKQGLLPGLNSVQLKRCEHCLQGK
ncbi:hypothetical protein Dimus_038798 [Dionaea muscipula]